jgi:phosphate-selective porin OprO/OprP
MALVSASPAAAQQVPAAALSFDLPAFPSAAADAQKAGKKTEKPWLTFRWDEHPSLRGGKKELRIDFKARTQYDLRYSEAAIDKSGDVVQDIAKRRIGMEGDIYNAVAFEVNRELTSTDPWRDVYVDYHQFHFVQAQWGKFKLPFSLEENAGAANLDFAYRSNAASQLSPGRDRGWMIHGQVLDHAVGYQFGKFDHDGKNASPSESNPERVTGAETVAWRLTSEPFRRFKSPLADFEIGIARTGSDLVEGFSTLNGKTVFGATFFGSNQLVNGRRERQGFEMRWRPGPASIKTEYIRLTEERLGESVEDTDLSPREAVGWYISGTWAITGEKNKDVNLPNRPLLQGGYGAVEVAVRLEKLTWGSVEKGAGSTSPRTDIIPANSDKALTIGANWYPNKWVKIQVNLIHEEIADPSHGPLPARPSFWSRIVRLQFGI